MDDGVGGEREEVAAGVGEAGEQANWWAMVVVVVGCWEGRQSLTVVGVEMVGVGGVFFG